MIKKLNDKNEKRLLSLSEAIDSLKKGSEEKKRKFVETVNIIFNLNIDPKESSQNLRGSILLPAGTGKKVKVIVLAPEENLQKEALAAGATLAGMDDLIEKIEEGFLDFDVCVASPNAMRSLSKVAKKLGPRGLMPNPKTGTVTKDVANAVKEILKGKANFKNDKFGIVHMVAGKINFTKEDLLANIKTIISTIKKAKPENSKGKFIKSVFLSTTMGSSVGINIDVEKL
jgi:large subunit ribosomal protein L1